MVSLTFDIDWAPDFVIDDVAARLIARSVKATWFVTHASPAVSRLAARPDLFELGIHPNFLPGSDHGSTPADVLRHVMRLVPNAVSVRTHGLVQSGAILDDILTHTPVTVDSSLFLPRMPGIQAVPYWRRGTRTIQRLPFFWSDLAEAERDEPEWSLAPLLDNGPGLKVFAFHPIHVYLNSSDDSAYRRLKERVSRLADAVPAVVAPLRQPGAGTNSMFEEVVAHLARTGRSACLHEIALAREDVTSAP
jgi:hypothetical protein